MLPQRGCFCPGCLKACIVFFLAPICVLKRVVVITYTVFSHAPFFKKRSCVIFIYPLSCLIRPSFIDYNEFETRENFRFYAQGTRTLGIVRNITCNNLAAAIFHILYFSSKNYDKISFYFPWWENYKSYKRLTKTKMFVDGWTQFITYFQVKSKPLKA